MSVHTGLVLELENGKKESKVVQMKKNDNRIEYQTFNIYYFKKKAVIYSTRWPDHCLTLEGKISDDLKYFIFLREYLTSIKCWNFR